jgi:hypothetical protein
VARSHHRSGLLHPKSANNLANNLVNNLAGSRPREGAGDLRQPANRPQPVQRVLLLARTANLLHSGSLTGLADAIHSASDGFSSLGALRANLPANPRPDRHHTDGQRTVVKPTDLATAHRKSDQVVQRLDAHCGPLRCAVHLEPHDPARALLTPGAGDG